MNLKLLLAFWFLLPALSFGADTPVAEEPVAKPDDTPAQVQPERKTRKRPRNPRQDVVRIGSSAELRAGESCGDFVVIGGSAKVDGQVNGDLVVIGTSAKLGSNAVVKGDFVAIGSLVDQNEAAVVHGERVTLGSIDGLSDKPWLRWPFEWVSKGLLWGRPLPHQYPWAWGLAGLFLLLYLGMALLFPRPVQTCVNVLEGQPGTSFLAGLLAFFLFLPVLALLTISMVGLVVVPFLLAASVAAFFLGKAVVYTYAGQQVGSQFGIEALRQPLPAVLCGTVLFCLFYAVPVVGFIVWGAVAPLGVGAVTLAVAKKFRSSNPPSNGAAPVPVMLGGAQASTEGAAMPQPNVLPMPRVGFWLRLLATLIDAALVVFIVARVLHLPKWVPLFWTAYHIAMWAWIGTTVGGLVFRLKIVRTDGQPIDFAVALVRSLSSFLSAAALFLGFFWAGWTQDRQAWHDRIAGTVVVKLPRGVSPIR